MLFARQGIAPAHQPLPLFGKGGSLLIEQLSLGRQFDQLIAELGALGREGIPLGGQGFALCPQGVPLGFERLSLSGQCVFQRVEVVALGQPGLLLGGQRFALGHESALLGRQRFALGDDRLALGRGSGQLGRQGFPLGGEGRLLGRQRFPFGGGGQLICRQRFPLGGEGLFFGRQRFGLRGKGRPFGHQGLQFGIERRTLGSQRVALRGQCAALALVRLALGRKGLTFGFQRLETGRHGLSLDVECFALGRKGLSLGVERLALDRQFLPLALEGFALGGHIGRVLPGRRCGGSVGLLLLGLPGGPLVGQAGCGGMQLGQFPIELFLPGGPLVFDLGGASVPSGSNRGVFLFPLVAPLVPLGLAAGQLGNVAAQRLLALDQLEHFTLGLLERFAARVLGRRSFGFELRDPLGQHMFFTIERLAALPQGRLPFGQGEVGIGQRPLIGFELALFGGQVGLAPACGFVPLVDLAGQPIELGLPGGNLPQGRRPLGLIGLAFLGQIGQPALQLRLPAVELGLTFVVPLLPGVLAVVGGAMLGGGQLLLDLLPLLFQFAAQAADGFALGLQAGLLVGQLGAAVGQGLARGLERDPLGRHGGLAGSDLFQRLIVVGRQRGHLGQSLPQAADFGHQALGAPPRLAGALRFRLAGRTLGRSIGRVIANARRGGQDLDFDRPATDAVSRHELCIVEAPAVEPRALGPRADDGAVLAAQNQAVARFDAVRHQAQGRIGGGTDRALAVRQRDALSLVVAAADAQPQFAWRNSKD